MNRNMHPMMSRSNTLRQDRMMTTRYSGISMNENDHKYDDSKDKISLKEEMKDDAYDSKSYSRLDYKDMHMYGGLDQGNDNMSSYLKKKKGKRRSKKDQEGRNFR